MRNQEKKIIIDVGQSWVLFHFILSKIVELLYESSTQNNFRLAYRSSVSLACVRCVFLPTVLFSFSLLLLLLKRNRDTCKETSRKIGRHDQSGRKFSPLLKLAS